MATTDNRLPTEGTQKDIESDLRTIKSSIDTLANSISPTAANVSFSNTGTGMTASNVQSAIVELNDEKQDSTIGGALTGPNFNTLTENKNYWINLTGSTNGPITGGYGYLEVILVATSGNGIRMQRFTRYSSSGTEMCRTYVRQYANNQWYSWIQIY